MAALLCACAFFLFQPAILAGSAFADDAVVKEMQPDADGAVVVEGVVVEDEAGQEQIDDDAVPMASGIDDGAVEQIDDDENPMASGLEKRADGAPLYLVTLAALAAVVAFFATSTHRVNLNIAAMNRKIR